MIDLLASLFLWCCNEEQALESKWLPFPAKENLTYFSWNLPFLGFTRSSSGFSRVFILEYSGYLSLLYENFQIEETAAGERFSLLLSLRGNKPFSTL